MSGLSHEQKNALKRIQQKYQQLHLSLGDKYLCSDEGSFTFSTLSTQYPMNNEALEIENMRLVSRYKRMAHVTNPLSPLAPVAEVVITHLHRLLSRYEARWHHKADAIRYLMIYENLDAAYTWGMKDLSPISLKEVMSRCLLYRDISRDLYFRGYWDCSTRYFSQTFNDIFESISPMVLDLLSQYSKRGIANKLTEVIQLLTTMREYLFIYSTSSDILAPSGKEAEAKHYRYAVAAKVSLKDKPLGVISKSQSVEGYRYVHLLLLTKQLAQIYENEFNARIFYRQEAPSKEEVHEALVLSNKIEHELGQLYQDYAQHGVYNGPVKQALKLLESRGGDYKSDPRYQKLLLKKSSSFFRSGYAPVRSSHEGILGCITNVWQIANLCGGYLYSDSRFYSNKTGFIIGELPLKSIQAIVDETTHAKDILVNEFVRPLITLQANYLTLTGALIHLKLCRDCYNFHGEVGSVGHSQWFDDTQKHILAQLSSSYELIKSVNNYIHKIGQWHECIEMQAIYKALFNEYNGGLSLEVRLRGLLQEISEQMRLMQTKRIPYLFQNKMESQKSKKLTWAGLGVSSEEMDSLIDNIKMNTGIKNPKETIARCQSLVNDYSEELYDVISKFTSAVDISHHIEFI